MVVSIRAGSVDSWLWVISGDSLAAAVRLLCCAWACWDKRRVVQNCTALFFQGTSQG